MEKDYIIVHILGKIQVHCTKCNLSNTLIVEWGEKVPRAMSLRTIINLIETHEEKFHKS